MHKFLKLHHHKHTGKVLHHRHTSYRALAIVVVLAGACMLLTNRMAQAADYIVTAKISAPLPSGAPVITSPTEGSVFSTPAITINGSCPLSTPAILVVIYEGTTALGTAQCSALGTFTVPVTLHTGVQQLVATVVNITDDVGDSSTPLTVTYTPPPAQAPAPTAPSGTTTPKPSNPRSTPRGGGEQELEIRSRSPFIVYSPSKPAVWRGSFAGGQPPYTANIAWGDGTTSWLKQVGSEQQEVSHSYAEVKSAYRVTITLRDSGGHELQMRLLAVSPTTTSGALTTPKLNTPFPFSRYLYLLYLLTLLVLIGLWVIEHRQTRLALVPVARKKQARRTTSSAAKRKRRS